MNYEILPHPWVAVEEALKTFGGWSRMFTTSMETYDQKYTIMRYGEPGFWEMFARVKAEEQFREAVEELYYDYKYSGDYPYDGRDKKTIKKDIGEALLNSNWKPVKGIIKTEVRLLKSEIEEDVSCLRPKRKTPRK